MLIKKRHLRTFLRPLFVLQIFRFRVKQHMITEQLVRELNVCQGRLPLTGRISTGVLNSTARQAFNVDDELGVVLSNPRLRRHVLYSVLDLVTTGAVALASLRNCLPRLQGSVSRFVLYR